VVRDVVPRRQCTNTRPQGLIGINALTKFQSEFAGAVLSSPLIALDGPPVPPAAISFMRLLSSWFPRMELDKLNNETMVTYLPIKDQYVNDPVAYHGRITARMSYEILVQLTKTLAELAPRVTLPYLLIHGGKDRISSPVVSEQFHQATKSTQKRFQKLDCMHETLNDNDPKVLALVVEWLKSRLQ
jgi:acylglycerol lipase